MATHETLLSMVRSWGETERTACATSSILEWVAEKNRTVQVSIQKAGLTSQSQWFYDEQQGCIRNQSGSFFSVMGLRVTREDGSVLEQPVLLQPEIGFLGIICKEIDGVMHFLMQAKIEPGNVNKIQISPTIQATKSNFTQKHGGKKPAYLDYFLHAEAHEIVVDQIQSEQSSRFYHKRNRNIILRAEGDIPVLPSHCWMTLGQIHQLMRVDNLVNMDTRTVLSCIPYERLVLTETEREAVLRLFHDAPLFRSIFEREEENPLPGLYHGINDRKMFCSARAQLIPLKNLRDWDMLEDRIVCRNGYPFSVIYCDISIAGREVTHWFQPLFQAEGIALFGLMCCDRDGKRLFVVHLVSEIGCFDHVELGPTVQREASSFAPEEDPVTALFFEYLNRTSTVLYDHLLSEEGGRFYHEQNRNVILKVPYEALPPLPDGYFLLDYRTLNELIQINNTVNIQLRNLLSLLEP